MTHKPPKQKNDRERNHESPVDVGLEGLPVVTLSDKEYRLCELIAEARALTYDGIDGGVVHGDQTSVDAHLTGAVGEYSFQKLTGNLQQAIYLLGDPGYDVKTDGYEVDVKATRTHIDYPDLLIPASQDLVADIYVLAHQISPREVRLMGWASRDHVAAQEPEQYPGHRWNRVVRANELRAP